MWDQLKINYSTHAYCNQRNVSPRTRYSSYIWRNNIFLVILSSTILDFGQISQNVKKMKKKKRPREIKVSLSGLHDSMF